jgi:catechol 2,3-dioxygenase-like lactoylglutathione lyase family enzyme
MTHRGFSHIGLSTLDLDKTREFYEGVLGLKPVVADTITIEEGGRLRHLFFDVGGDQLVAFLEPQDVPGVPTDYDAGINRGLGVPPAFITLPSRPARRLPWRRSATNSAPRASRSPISSTTNGPSRSTSKIRTACRSNIAA